MLLYPCDAFRIIGFPIVLIVSYGWPLLLFMFAVWWIKKVWAK